MGPPNTHLSDLFSGASLFFLVSDFGPPAAPGAAFLLSGSPPGSLMLRLLAEVGGGGAGKWHHPAVYDWEN